MQVRRVVTGHDADGKAVFVSDEQVAPVTLALLPGIEFHQLWGSDTTCVFPDDGRTARRPQYFPPVGGFRFAFFTIPPDGGAGAPADLDIAAALAEFAQKLPGLAEHLEPDDPGMHTTATVDSGVVVSGPVTLELDDGADGRAPPRRHLRAERHPPPLVQPHRHAGGDRGRPHRRAPRAGRRGTHDLRVLRRRDHRPGRAPAHDPPRAEQLDDRVVLARPARDRRRAVGVREGPGARALRRGPALLLRHGPEVFAGNDTLGARAARPAHRSRRNEAFRTMAMRLQDSFTALERARMPVLCAIQGACVGGGIDMVSAADLRYADETAFFSIAEINIGMTADVGTLQRMPKLVPEGIVRELAYTGRRWTAAEAQAAGFVNAVFPDHDALVAGVLAIAAEIADKPPIAVWGTKQTHPLHPRPLGRRRPRADRELERGDVRHRRHGRGLPRQGRGPAADFPDLFPTSDGL